MRYIGFIVFLLWPVLVSAQDWEDRQIFNAQATSAPLRILSSTDTVLFAPFLQTFVDANVDVSIEYLVAGTADIDRIFRAAPAQFDVVVSSAMDLQFKLANDGFAKRIEGTGHPAWAQWRQSLFAFTSEPAAIVINRAAFAGHPVPKTRQELIEALRARPQIFAKKVGTYDVRQSGLGYLFATQDARASETFWRLMEVMGGLDVQLYCCSGEMIDDLSAGRIVVAYNVLGSYAAARAQAQDALEIILPADFPTTMMRTGFVSRHAPQSNVAQRFLRHLIARQDGVQTAPTGLPGLARDRTSSAHATISLEPALLTFLDRLKRETFLAEWEAAVIQD